jgi:hypothetical protein
MFDNKKSHSEETKKILSEKRKAYLATHKHNWSRYSNKESLPEQKFRELIEKSNFKLKQYYIPPVKLIYKHIKFYNLTIDNKKAKLPPSEKIIESRLKSRKVDRPSKEELKKMLWEMPTVQLAKKFGVSDKAIEKWAKAYNLEKPPRGYWEKLKAGKL